MGRRKSKREARNTKRRLVLKSDSQSVLEEFQHQPKRSIKKLAPRNATQAACINAIENRTITLATGYPGTGKSYIPAVLACNMLQESKIKRIVICRPNIGVGPSIGLLPGDMIEKMKAWCAPILDVMYNVLGKSYTDYLIKTEVIMLLPLEYARGRSFDDTFMILDEAQNVDKESFKCILTRTGMNTKLFIDGDVGQCDIGQSSGLGKLIHLIEQYHTPIAQIDFGLDDIVRSDVCKYMVELFQDSGF